MQSDLHTTSHSALVNLLVLGSFLLSQACGSLHANRFVFWKGRAVKLHVTTWGDSSSTRVAVLLHGITGSAGSWVQTGMALGKLGYYSIAPDLRGHGDSPKPNVGYALRTLVGDIRETVPRRPELLIGHSLGGTLAVLAASEKALEPRHLVLEDPVLVMPSAERAASVIDEVEATPREMSAYLEANPQASPDDAKVRLRALASLAWPQARQIFVGNAPWDLTTLLGAVVPLVPTLCILPESSDWVGPTLVNELRMVLGPDAVIIVPAAGHNIHKDNLPGFLEAVIGWLPPRFGPVTPGATPDQLTARSGSGTAHG